VYNKHLAVMVILALSVILDLLIPYDYVYAQGNQTEENTIFTSNNNMSDGTSNTTGIMKNTSGIIDDAFDALKDTFGSFFEK
jgi:hypothetical protein